eukprot:EG_transcript_10910
MGCICPRVAPAPQEVQLQHFEQTDNGQLVTPEKQETITFTAAAAPEPVPKLKLNSMSLSSGSDNAPYHRSCSVRTKGSLDDDSFDGSGKDSRKRSQSITSRSPRTPSDRRPSIGSQGTTLRFKLRNNNAGGASPRDPAAPQPPRRPSVSDTVLARRRSSVVFVSASSEQLPASGLACADLMDPDKPLEPIPKSNSSESISDELNSMLHQLPAAMTYNELMQQGSLVMQCGGTGRAPPSMVSVGVHPPSDAP